MSYSRFTIVPLLVGIILAGAMPIQAQQTTHPIITADNINQLVEISHLGRGKVSDLAWSSDGQTLAIGGGAGIWLYSADYEETALLEGSVQDIRWIPDSRQILAINFRNLSLWDADAGEILTTVELEGSAPRDVAVSPDGTQIAVASGRSLRLLDSESLTVDQQIEGQSGTVNAVAWLNATELISADSHGSLARWNAETGRPLANQELGTGIQTIRLSPTGSFLAIAFTTGDFQVVEMQSDTTLIATNPDTDLLVEIAWSPDGAKLATARSSGTVQIWNIETGQITADMEVFIEAGRAFQFDIAWTTSGDRLVAATEAEVVLFNTETGMYVRLIDQFSIDSFDVTWSPDSTYLGATWFAPPPNDKIAVWDVPNTEMIAFVEHGWNGMWLADNQSFVYLDQVSRPVSFRVWALGENAPISNGELSGSAFVHVSPDGSRFVTEVSDGVLEIRSLNSDSSAVINTRIQFGSTAWSPRSTYFLTAGPGQIQIWDAATGDIVQSLDTFASSDFAFSPDETRLALATGEDQFEVWDLQTGQLLDTVQTSYNFRFLDWSPNGDLLVISPVDAMSFWSTETWEEVFTVETSGRAQWSPDGSMIATPGSDGIIRIWGIPTP